MKIKVYVLDLEIPRRTKRVAVLLSAPLAVLIGLGAIAYATVPNVFMSGEPLSSAQMNANFGNLDGRLTAVEAILGTATADGGYSLGATYCGPTAATLGSFSGPGTLTGYASAKAQCQAVTGCSPKTAHMCTSEEMVRTRQLGGQIDAGAAAYGWFSTGSYGYYPGTGTYTGDCEGWTTNSASVLGDVWGTTNTPPVIPQPTYCSGGPYPILCCN
jgi:hypothetical protein